MHFYLETQSVVLLFTIFSLWEWENEVYLKPNLKDCSIRSAVSYLKLIKPCSIQSVERYNIANRRGSEGSEGLEEPYLKYKQRV